MGEDSIDPNRLRPQMTIRSESSAEFSNWRAGSKSSTHFRNGRGRFARPRETFMSQPLSARRVLLVEDEALVAMLLETILEDMGCIPVGPAATVEEGR
jgi:hypothetical protein